MLVNEVKVSVRFGSPCSRAGSELSKFILVVILVLIRRSNTSSLKSGNRHMITLIDAQLEKPTTTRLMMSASTAHIHVSFFFAHSSWLTHHGDLLLFPFRSRLATVVPIRLISVFVRVEIHITHGSSPDLKKSDTPGSVRTLITGMRCGQLRRIEI